MRKSAVGKAIFTNQNSHALEDQNNSPDISMAGMPVGLAERIKRGWDEDQTLDRPGTDFPEVGHLPVASMPPGRSAGGAGVRRWTPANRGSPPSLPGQGQLCQTLSTRIARSFVLQAKVR